MTHWGPDNAHSSSSHAVIALTKMTSEKMSLMDFMASSFAVKEKLNRLEFAIRASMKVISDREINEGLRRESMLAFEAILTDVDDCIEAFTTQSMGLLNRIQAIRAIRANRKRHDQQVKEYMTKSGADIDNLLKTFYQAWLDYKRTNKLPDPDRSSFIDNRNPDASSNQNPDAAANHEDSEEEAGEMTFFPESTESQGQDSNKRVRVGNNRYMMEMEL